SLLDLRRPIDGGERRRLCEGDFLVRQRVGLLAPCRRLDRPSRGSERLGSQLPSTTGALRETSLARLRFLARAASQENDPGPKRPIARKTRHSVSGTSKPLFSEKKPDFQCTRVIAPNISMNVPAAATRVKKPRISPSPAATSPNDTRYGTTTG